MALSEETRLVLGLVSMFLAGLLLIALAAWLGSCSILPWTGTASVGMPQTPDPAGPWVTLERAAWAVGTAVAAGAAWALKVWLKARNGGSA